MFFFFLNNNLLIVLIKYGMIYKLIYIFLNELYKGWLNLIIVLYD